MVQDFNQSDRDSQLITGLILWTAQKSEINHYKELKAADSVGQTFIALIVILIAHSELMVSHSNKYYSGG